MLTSSDCVLLFAVLVGLPSLVYATALSLARPCVSFVEVFWRSLASCNVCGYDTPIHIQSETFYVQSGCLSRLRSRHLNSGRNRNTWSISSVCCCSWIKDKADAFGLQWYGGFNFAKVSTL